MTTSEEPELSGMDAETLRRAAELLEAEWAIPDEARRIAIWLELLARCRRGGGDSWHPGPLR